MKEVRHISFIIACILFSKAFGDDETEKSFNIQNTTFVQTNEGWLLGRILEYKNIKYHSFKGIPYAEPPVGKLRFQAPIPHQKWTGIRPALEHGSYCANRFGFIGNEALKGGSEDCLFLNVYTRKMTGKKPVMFWIHGGSFVSGNGDTTLYGPEHLVKEDIVLVTINYRLSAFGFLSSGDGYAPGNQGLKDMVLALKWVKANIRKFGGDPNQVTIFGQSAGSISVHYLLISDMSNGLFNKAIMQSATSLAACCYQPDPKTQAETLGRRLNLKFANTKELIEKLTEIDFQRIVDIETPVAQFQTSIPSGMRPLEFVPCVEPKNTLNAFLTEEPTQRMIDGNFKKIPVMIGNTNFEGMFFAVYYYAMPAILNILNSNPNFIVPISLKLSENSQDFSEAVKQMQKLYFNGKKEGTMEEWLQVYSDEIVRTPDDRVVRFSAARNYSNIYHYEFAFDGSLNFFKKLLSLALFKGASHCDDLFYLFEPGIKGFVADYKSTLIRNRMTKMWTNFAKFGNPTPKKDSLITEIWKPYTPLEKSYFVIDEVMENRNHPTRMDFISDLHLKYTGHF